MELFRSMIFCRTGVFSLLLSLSIFCAGCLTDDSDIRPGVSQVDLQIIERADQILNSETIWNRADDRIYRADATSFSLYTAIEKATLEIGGKFAHREAAMQEARFTIEAVAPKKNYDHRLMGYNNDPTTTFADIKHVLALTEARIIQRLHDQQ